MTVIHHYRKKDYAFGLRLLTLREKTGLTQTAAATTIGVSERVIRNWESGKDYPKETHLQALIVLYMQKEAFTKGQERDEAYVLWEQMLKHASRHKAAFDDSWFATLLLQENGQLDTSEAFFGREQELSELTYWMLADHCRLLTLVGMGGIGKTALALKLLQRVASDYHAIFWRSLKNAPTLDEVLVECIIYFSQGHLSGHQQSTKTRLVVLRELLYTHHCLLIFDSVEAVLQAGSSDGSYREGYEGYGSFFEHIAESRHQSCMLLISREKPKEIGILESSSAAVHSLPLAGLKPQESLQLLQQSALIGEQEVKERLVHLYMGNPFALTAVTKIIADLFEGDIARFLLTGEVLFSSIRYQLHQQFERLSPQEQKLLSSLAMKHGYVSIEELRLHLAYQVSSRELLGALHALLRRSLLIRGGNGNSFAMHPLLLRYMSERLVKTS